MANHVSSLKRARQTVTKTAINRANKSKLRGSPPPHARGSRRRRQEDPRRRLPLHRLGPRQERPEGCPAQEHRQPLQGPSQRPRQGRRHQGRLKILCNHPKEASPALASSFFPSAEPPSPIPRTVLLQGHPRHGTPVSVAIRTPAAPAATNPTGVSSMNDRLPRPAASTRRALPYLAAQHRPHRPSPRRPRASPRRPAPNPLRARARPRHRLHRHLRQPLRRLLQVRLRQLRRPQSHPLRPGRRRPVLHPLQRQHPGAQRHPHQVRRSQPQPHAQPAEDRRLLRRLHEHRPHRQEGPHPHRPAPPPDRHRHQVRPRSPSPASSSVST